jgi:hypothetical protein
MIQIFYIRKSKSVSRPPFSIWRNKHWWACIILLSALKYNININIPSVQTETVAQSGRRIRRIEYGILLFFLKNARSGGEQTIHGKLGWLKRTRSFIPTQIIVKLGKQWTVAGGVLNRENITTTHTRAVHGAMVTLVSKPPDLMALRSFNDVISSAEVTYCEWDGTTTRTKLAAAVTLLT